MDLTAFSRARLIGSACVIAGITFWSATASAQTDFYNTDRGRPIQVEDAYATERYAFEIKIAPVRLERSDDGVYNWGLDPEIAFGVLPRTHVELGLPLVFAERGGTRRSGVAGLELSAMHNFNVETEGVPALGLRADVLFPVGPLAAERTYTSLTGMVTRTQRWARFHVNAQYTAGKAPALRPAVVGGSPGTLGATEVSRWLAGLAIDKTYPLSSMLVTAEFFGRQPILANEDVEYNLGTGVRYQLSPSLALDGGLGRRLNGDSRGWYFTFGSAYALGLRSLFPGG